MDDEQDEGGDIGAARRDGSSLGQAGTRRTLELEDFLLLGLPDLISLLDVTLGDVVEL